MHESELDDKLYFNPAIKRNRLDFPHPLDPLISKLDFVCKENVNERMSTLIFEERRTSTFQSVKT
jgi:hypothetical protein